VETLMCIDSAESRLMMGVDESHPAADRRKNVTEFRLNGKNNLEVWAY
jgi:hypothetical protein